MNQLLWKNLDLNDGWDQVCQSARGAYPSWFSSPEALPFCNLDGNINFILLIIFCCFIYAEHTELKNSKKEQKQTRYKNTIHLWEFLLELLEDERYVPLISWTRKEEGEFKIKRQEEVARRWGRLKQRAGMNYDKLSRALRYYYQKGIIKKVSN